LGQKKVVLQDRWPVKGGSIHMKFVMAGPEKMWPFNAGDCLNRGDHVGRFDSICIPRNG
jgi:hypothetical protein